MAFTSIIAASLLALAAADCSRGGQCYLLRLQQCSGSSDWTLHGLWPQWQENCGSPAFDPNAVSSISSEMNAEWMSCPGHGDTNEQFWSHEWKTHGACSGMSELNFFSKALQLRDQYASQCQGSNQCSICFSQDLSSTVACSESTVIV